MGSGWKGKTGGVGMMLSGVAMLFTMFSAGTLDAPHAIEAFGLISAGLGVFGIRAALPS